MKYCSNLAIDGGRKMAEILETDVMEEVGNSKRCNFANVRLPIALGKGENEIDGNDAIKIAQWIAEKLAMEHDAYIAIYIHGGKLWTRLSAQIYIDLEDIERGAKVLKELCERVVRGDVPSEHYL